MPERNVWAILAGVAATLGSLGGLGVALLVRALTCDDRSTAWRDNPDAWQWDAHLAVAGVATLCALYALWAGITRRRVVPALAAAALLWLTWWELLTW